MKISAQIPLIMSSDSVILGKTFKKLRACARGFLFLGVWASLLASPVYAVSSQFPVKSAGIATTSKQDVNAFSQPSANLSFEKRLDFSVGNSFFRNPWVIAPASTTARDGLGPLFNTNGCQNCHIKDGRGHLPESPEDNLVSALVRLSRQPASKKEWQQVRKQGALPDPNYGTQIQDFAIAGHMPEARIVITYDSHWVELNGGQKVELVKPVVSLEDLHYGPVHSNTVASLLIAPPMIGLGLLEAIPDATLQSMADPEDKNGDGISGRINWVNQLGAPDLAVGRFGWKAEQPSLKQQNAAAFLGDIGITSSLFPKENCQPSQRDCAQAIHGGTPEVSDNILNKVTFYTRNLAVPKRRNALDKQVLRGESLFIESGCQQCHRTGLVTALLPNQPEQSELTIYPYTDLLLHDMGEGLADHRAVFGASGSEWRTAPLWGIGLTAVVNGKEHYLHDGRARTLLEAILWHGGEAYASKQTVVDMAPSDRLALIKFLQSL
ncbi:MAG: thiol oxidoreductase [Pseudomonadales bacterium]|nr:thiol oxidoreductase [Pseudomonadales bacterium]